MLFRCVCYVFLMVRLLWAAVSWRMLENNTVVGKRVQGKMSNDGGNRTFDYPRAKRTFMLTPPATKPGCQYTLRRSKGVLTISLLRRQTWRHLVHAVRRGVLGSVCLAFLRDLARKE